MEVARVGIKERRTRGEETEASSGTVKRTKLAANDGELTLSPTLIQLRSSVGNVTTKSTENSTSPRLDVDPSSISDYDYVTKASDHVAVTSCCSSNASSEFGNDSLQNLDPQLPLKSDETVHTSEFNFRGSELELEVDSVRFVLASQPLEAATTKMPSESELEEFFSAAEKNIQERFIEKYNYDIAKDAPLEGRYEWIQMKP